MIYFFHIFGGPEPVLDSEGLELRGVADAARHMLVCARDIIAEEVRTGRLDLGQRIVAVDAAGQSVASLSFEEALVQSKEKPRAAPARDEPTPFMIVPRG